MMRRTDFSSYADGLENGKQGGVDEDYAILRVVDNVRQLLGREAQIERGAARNRRRESQIQFQVARAVPAQRSDTISGFDSEVLEHVSEAVAPRR